MKKQDDNGVFHDVRTIAGEIDDPPMFFKTGDRVVVDTGLPDCRLEETVVSCYLYRYGGDMAPATVETVTEPVCEKIRTDNQYLQNQKHGMPMSSPIPRKSASLDLQWSVPKQCSDIRGETIPPVMQRKHDEKVKSI